jgi:hypothetical protein
MKRSALTARAAMVLASLMAPQEEGSSAVVIFVYYVKTLSVTCIAIRSIST